MRSLYAGFKRYKGVSPMLALKNRRLESARDDLLRADPADSVTSIALKWGFEHLGNFSRDYFRRFGEHPSETLRHSLH
jgi:transcriptional regulator GlxA family with amidase domain